MQKITLCLLVFLVLGIVCTVYAANESRIADLRRKQLEVVQQMQSRRVEMLRTNTELKRLQDEKMKLHRKMAIIMDADPDLFELQQQYVTLDAEVERLERNEGIRADNMPDSSVKADSPIPR